MSKALLIDFKKGDIPTPYFDRLKKDLSSYAFITNDDKGLRNTFFDVEIIFSQINTKINKEIIDSAPNLRYIGMLSTAYDAVDVNYAKKKGVVTCNLGGYSTETVVEFFFTDLFEAIRELDRAKLQARNGDYNFTSFMGLELKDNALGVIGAGKIGSRVVEIALGIGMKVIYFSRKNKAEIKKLGAVKKGLDKVFSESDFLSINLVLNKDTEGIINISNVNLIKKNCVFINLAPLELVEKKAIFERLRRNDLTYILDHADSNPEVTKELSRYKNCVIYPPIAFRTSKANKAKWEIFVSNFENFINGKTQNVVNT